MSRKSQALRAQGFTNVYADHEKDKRKPGYIYKTSLYRPWLFLVNERIVTLSALINGYVYGKSETIHSRWRRLELIVRTRQA
jgi:hypothetical protein